MKTKFISLFLLILTLNGCADEPISELKPISESFLLEVEQENDTFNIFITSTHRTITINSVKLNNGQCHASLKLTAEERLQKYKNGSFNTKKKVGFPLVINLGETRVIQVNAIRCQLQNIDVNTTEGRVMLDNLNLG